MNSNDILEYCLSKKGASESFPFDEETLVFKVGKKIFLLMSLEKIPLVINVKTNPEWSEELRELYPQITGAFHMNKKHWNSVTIEGLKSKLIYELIDHSYDLVLKSLSQKDQREMMKD